MQGSQLQSLSHEFEIIPPVIKNNIFSTEGLDLLGLLDFRGIGGV